MIEMIITVVLFLILIYATVSLYLSVSVTPVPTKHQAPKITIERLNYLYQNDYTDFLTVKQELEERGWKIIYLKNETIS